MAKKGFVPIRQAIGFLEKKTGLVWLDPVWEKFFTLLLQPVVDIVSEGIIKVINGGTGVDEITDHAIMLGSGTDPISTVGPGLDGQIPIGSTDDDPVMARITPGNGIDITNGEGSIEVDADLKENGGLVIEATELAVDLGASDITGTLGVTDGGTGVETLTDGGVIVGSGTSPVTSLSRAADGELVIGSTGLDPEVAALTGTAKQVIVTNGPGSITLATPQDIDTDSTPEFAGMTLTGELDMTDNPITDLNYIDFNLINGVAAAEGRLVHNDAEGTLNYGMKGGNVNLQIGLEQLIYGKNVTGTGTTNGRPARISGASGTNPEFSFADANDPTAFESVGLFTEDIVNNGNGYVTTSGLVRDVDTSGTPVGEVWGANTRLFVSNTPGELTNVLPLSTERKIFIGIVLKANSTTGIIWVNPINIFFIEELSGNSDGAGNPMVRIDASIPEVRLGGDDNRTAIEEDGTMRMDGDATVWDDLQVSISNIRIPPASAPTWRQYDHGIAAGVTYPVLGFAVGEYVYFDVQTQHAMKLSTVLDQHIHYMTPTDGTGDRFQFQLDCIAAPIDGNWAVPAGSPFTKEVTMSADLSNSHKLEDLADVPAVNTTVSTLYKFKMERIAATQDEYAGEVYVEFADGHFEKDTVGSRQETSK